MRVLLKLELDCDPDAAWRAIKEPANLIALVKPVLVMRSLEPGGFPDEWHDGEPHEVAIDALGVVPFGRQRIEPHFVERPDGVRMVVDEGGGTGGSLGLVTEWQHTMAVSALPGGRTLFRDRLRVGAGALTPLVWLSMWAFWQYRAVRLRSLARSWR
ncbi:hypothetical protein [Desertivibrio insolitus]|uniref:hypothetical protein n=1 Tax=Herbiconiux sp. SYSU D00978 TaxID=2812562 RepID=UPI001A959D22|nr:hypothetical protein [Herbiconiux sp. SYSU D00978]